MIITYNYHAPQKRWTHMFEYQIRCCQSKRVDYIWLLHTYYLKRSGKVVWWIDVFFQWDATRLVCRKLCRHIMTWNGNAGVCVCMLFGKDVFSLIWLQHHRASPPDTTWYTSNISLIWCYCVALKTFQNPCSNKTYSKNYRCLNI